MAFTPQTIGEDLDFANLAKHNDNNAAIKTELDAHGAKLSTITNGAEPNQNAFASVNDVVATGESDALEIVGSTGITVTTSPTNKRVTITATGTAAPGAHGSTHGEGGADPIPELVALQADMSEVTAQLKETRYETTSRIIYVKTNGDDNTGDGNLNNPFKTITKALATVNKNIANIITIKVYPGDYRSEGPILVKNYRGSFLMITAFDGSSDILTPNDNYLVERITIYDSEAIYLQGLKCTPTTGNYGIYVSNSRFVKVNGNKNESAGSSGFGCTGNSFVWVENCTANNLSTVISANHGATVVSQNWINSTINDNGIIVDVGSKVHLYDDNQPLATIKYTTRNSGIIFNKEGVFNGGEKVVVTSFLNDWTNDTGYYPLTYWKDSDGCVHIQGSIAAGAPGTVVFVLPPAFRPSRAVDLVAVATDSGTIAGFRVYLNGNVQQLSGGNSHVSISAMFLP